MAIPFEPQLGPPPTDLLQLQLLVAPFPALSGDGQLRELMLERRRHQAIGEAGLWYCPPNLSSMLGVVGYAVKRLISPPPRPSLTWPGSSSCSSS